MLDRRDFIKKTIAIGTGSLLLKGSILPGIAMPASAFKISLAQWSIHKALFAGDIEHLSFAKLAKQEFGIDGIEYVNQFFKDKANDKAYLKEMKTRADDQGVKSLIIMCDGEGRLGDPDDAKRLKAVENHYRWVEAAKYLGCHSIRVNASSAGSYAQQMLLAADGLSKLTEFAANSDLNVIVENHGGLSSDGKWLVGVMKTVDHPRCGTLPDFGNFAIDRQKDIWYDRYEGVRELMPYAKAVSAKSHDFDSKGDETKTDYFKMMKLVLEAGYNGYVGIEYEGSNLSEFDGIKATKLLLERVLAKSLRNPAELAVAGDM